MVAHKCYKEVELSEMQSDIKQILEFINKMKGKSEQKENWFGNGWAVTLILLIIDITLRFVFKA